MMVNIHFDGTPEESAQAVRQLQEAYIKLLERVYDKLLEGSDN